MVREKHSARPRPKAPARPKAKVAARRKPGSIWDTPHIKEILAQPVGSPMDLTPEEARAIIREGPLETPRPMRDGAKEVRKIRRWSGAILVRPHD
jgi:hypothetical protein